jgi:hypothetical protein
MGDLLKLIWYAVVGLASIWSDCFGGLRRDCDDTAAIAIGAEDRQQLLVEPSPIFSGVPAVVRQAP